MIDSSQMALLYEKYRDMLYNRAYQILTDIAAAEDAVQNVFVKLLKAASRLEIDDIDSYKTRAFMVIVGDNVAKTMYQNRAKKQHIPLQAQMLDVLIDVPGDSLAEAIISKEIYNDLENALATLDPQTADILRLRYFHDMRNTDIAALLGISRINIGMKITRGMKKLRVSIKEGGVSFDE